MITTDIIQIIKAAIDKTNMDFQVKAYAELMEKIYLDRTIKPLTRCAYECYYGMNQARLSLEWKNWYFDTLNKCLAKDCAPRGEPARHKRSRKYHDSRIHC